MLLYPYSSQLFSCFTTKFKAIILEEPIKNGDLAIDFYLQILVWSVISCHVLARLRSPDPKRRTIPSSKLSCKSVHDQPSKAVELLLA